MTRSECKRKNSIRRTQSCIPDSLDNLACTCFAGFEDVVAAAAFATVVVVVVVVAAAAAAEDRETVMVHCRN